MLAECLRGAGATLIPLDPCVKRVRVTAACEAALLSACLTERRVLRHCHQLAQGGSPRQERG